MCRFRSYGTTWKWIYTEPAMSNRCQCLSSVGAMLLCLSLSYGVWIRAIATLPQTKKPFLPWFLFCDQNQHWFAAEVARWRCQPNGRKLVKYLKLTWGGVEPKAKRSALTWGGVEPERTWTQCRRNEMHEWMTGHPNPIELNHNFTVNVWEVKRESDHTIQQTDRIGMPKYKLLLCVNRTNAI